MKHVTRKTEKIRHAGFEFVRKSYPNLPDVGPKWNYANRTHELDDTADHLPKKYLLSHERKLLERQYQRALA